MKAKFYTNMIFELDGIGVEVHDYRGRRALRPDEIDRLHRKPLGTARKIFDKRLSTTYILERGYWSIVALWVESQDVKIRDAILKYYYQG